MRWREWGQSWDGASLGASGLCPEGFSWWGVTFIHGFGAARAVQAVQSWSHFCRAVHFIICTDGSRCLGPLLSRAGALPGSPRSVAALRGWSLPRFLLQYRKHQHKLPDVVGAEVCTAQGVVLCL